VGRAGRGGERGRRQPHATGPGPADHLHRVSGRDGDVAPHALCTPLTAPPPCEQPLGARLLGHCQDQPGQGAHTEPASPAAPHAFPLPHTHTLLHSLSPRSPHPRPPPTAPHSTSGTPSTSSTGTRPTSSTAATSPSSSRRSETGPRRGGLVDATA
jgi:hypothetical protein